MTLSEECFQLIFCCNRYIANENIVIIFTIYGNMLGPYNRLTISEHY